MQTSDAPMDSGGRGGPDSKRGLAPPAVIETFAKHSQPRQPHLVVAARRDANVMVS